MYIFLGLGRYFKQFGKTKQKLAFSFQNQRMHDCVYKNTGRGVKKGNCHKTLQGCVGSFSYTTAPYGNKMAATSKKPAL